MECRGESVLVFDAETTGTDKRRDQVIELCVQFGLDASSENRVWRFRPDVPISTGAQAVHGISLDDVKDCPHFRERAVELRKVFDNAKVWSGYNLSFDIEMVSAEFQRLGQPALDTSDKIFVEAFRLWQRSEPRTLMDAHRRFVGDEFAQAHSATADVAATGRVLAGMLEHFNIEGDWNDIASICEPERKRWIGPSRHVQWDDAGRPVVGFGRHAGTPLVELAQGADKGYLRWILGQDFPKHVAEICQCALDSDPELFLRWVETHHGKAPVASAPEVTARAAG